MFPHWVYFTPHTVDLLKCLRCLKHPGTNLHMFWYCSKLTQFWVEIFDLINVHLQLSLPMFPKLELLSFHNDAQRPHYTKLLILKFVTVYYAKKDIRGSWNSPSLPSLSSWESMVNTVLPMYKLIHLIRNCPTKYDNVCQPWTAQ